MGLLAVDLKDVGKVMRSIGYVVSFDLQQTVAAEVDLNGDGELDATELKKLVRMVRDDDIEVMKDLLFHSNTIRLCHECPHPNMCC